MLRVTPPKLPHGELCQLLHPIFFAKCCFQPCATLCDSRCTTRQQTRETQSTQSVAPNLMPPCAVRDAPHTNKQGKQNQCKVLRPALRHLVRFEMHHMPTNKGHAITANLARILGQAVGLKKRTPLEIDNLRCGREGRGGSPPVPPNTKLSQMCPTKALHGSKQQTCLKQEARGKNVKGRITHIDTRILFHSTGLFDV